MKKKFGFPHRNPLKGTFAHNVILVSPSIHGKTRFNSPVKFACFTEILSTFKKQTFVFFTVIKKSPNSFTFLTTT